MVFSGGFGLYLIMHWKIEHDIEQDELAQINFLAEDYEEANETETSEPTTTAQQSAQSRDFASLKAINSTTLGWIKVNNTRIDYPIVQSDDNEYYLKHSFNHTLNSSGAIFLDYRNNANLNNKHTIVYGHGRNEGTMFGTLKNALKSNWQKNSENHIFTIRTENTTVRYQVFSVYRIPNTNDYLRTLFRNDNDFLEFITMLKNRSVYNFGTEISEKNQIITLSTCIGKGDRMVLHAKRLD